MEENNGIADNKEKHWRDVAEDFEDKSKIHALRWDVYTQEKEVMIKKEFSVAILHPKGGNIVWICAKDNITKKSRTTKLLDYVDLIIYYLRKRVMVGLIGIRQVYLFE